MNTYCRQVSRNAWAIRACSHRLPAASPEQQKLGEVQGDQGPQKSFFFFLFFKSWGDSETRGSASPPLPPPRSRESGPLMSPSPAPARPAAPAKFPGIQLLAPRRSARDPQLPPAPYLRARPITGFAPGRAPTWLAESLSPRCFRSALGCLGQGEAPREL